MIELPYTSKTDEYILLAKRGSLMLELSRHPTLDEAKVASDDYEGEGGVAILQPDGSLYTWTEEDQRISLQREIRQALFRQFAGRLQRKPVAPGKKLKTLVVPDDYCPWCDALLDRRSATASTDDDTAERAPKDGDYSICVHCAQICVYDSELKMRRATDTELFVLSRSQAEFYEELIAGQEYIRNMDRSDMKPTRYRGDDGGSQGE